MGELCKNLNKSLLPVGGRAALSLIVSKFPAGTRFVIAIGHLGNQIRDYFQVAHPDLNIAWVPVRNFDGPRSGPGTSLLSCRPHLSEPFFLVCADTLWNETLGVPQQDTIYVRKVEQEAASDYCTVSVVGNLVRALCNKQPAPISPLAFTGLAYIKSTRIFFNGIEKSQQKEIDLFEGFRALADARALKPKSLETWVDIGTHSKYSVAMERTRGEGFRKTGEQIYFEGTWVIKFFEDADICRKRVARANDCPYFPNILDTKGQFYSYRFVPGSTLYQENSPGLTERLLKRLTRRFWIPTARKNSDLKELCRRFYFDKTNRRVGDFLSHNPWAKHTLRINGVHYPSISNLLKKVPWRLLEQGVPSPIHGDFHFDNILYSTGTDRFTLLDWRQDFGGALEMGDLYYDFAKLNAGLVFDFSKLRQEKFDFVNRKDGFAFSAEPISKLGEHFEVAFRHARNHGLDIHKIHVLTSLIYLNMASLHQGLLAKLLFCAGVQHLGKSLRDGQRAFR